MHPFFIKIGDNKLSERPIRATPQTEKPMAPAYELVTKDTKSPERLRLTNRQPV